MQGKNKYVLLKLFIMKLKHVYLIFDTDFNLLFGRTAFSAEQDATEYAENVNKIRLANGMSFINYQIVEFDIQ